MHKLLHCKRIGNKNMRLGFRVRLPLLAIGLQEKHVRGRKREGSTAMRFD